MSEKHNHKIRAELFMSILVRHGAIVLLVAALAFMPACSVLDGAAPGPRDRRAKTGDARCFETFGKVKRYLHKQGTPQTSRWQWHHIVGQHKDNIANFGAYDLHCTDNLVYLHPDKHIEINRHYALAHPWTGKQNLRQWLTDKSFDDQFEYGLKVLKKFGVSYGY